MRSETIRFFVEYECIAVCPFVLKTPAFDTRSHRLISSLAPNVLLHRLNIMLGQSFGHEKTQCDSLAAQAERWCHYQPVYVLRFYSIVEINAVELLHR